MRKFAKRLRVPRCPYCKEPMELTEDIVTDEMVEYTRIRRYVCMGGEVGGHHAYVQINTLTPYEIKKKQSNTHIPAPVVDAIYGDKQ